MSSCALDQHHDWPLTTLAVRMSELNERQTKRMVVCGLMLLLVIAVARTNYGIWNSEIPLGDESTYISEAFSYFQTGRLPANSYLDLYVLCFKFNDPLIAYYCLRFTASLLSAIGLFLLLSSLNWASPFGAFAMASLWNLNLLSTPVIQGGNISLLGFALACFSGYLWISDFGKGAKVISLVILLGAVSARVGYGVLLTMIGVHSRRAGEPVERSSSSVTRWHWVTL
jgi:hypothetical protein